MGGISIINGSPSSPSSLILEANCATTIGEVAVILQKLSERISNSCQLAAAVVRVTK